MREHPPTDHKVEVSTRVRASLERAWTAWSEASNLSAWFTTNVVQDFRAGGAYSNGDGDSGTFVAIEPMRIIRFTWEQKNHHPGSEVEVRFEPVGDGETEIDLLHENLFDASEVADLTEGWSWALDSMKSWLETGRAIGFDAWKADGE